MSAVEAHLPLILALAVLGSVTGFVAGLMGVGGGVLVAPFLTIILSARGVPADLSVKMAIATSMATIVFTSLSSVRAHHRRGAVRWDHVRKLSPGIVLGGAVGSLGLFSALKGTWLAVLFAAFIGAFAVQLLRGNGAPGTRPMPATGGQLAAGSVIGLLAGLVGAGGAFISMPFMLAHDVALINAVATSAALGFPVALVNAVGYALGGAHRTDLPAGSLGYIWLPALAAIASCSVLTAPLGAKMAHSLAVGYLKRVMSGILFALASYMLWKGLHG